MVFCCKCTKERGIIKRPSDGLPYCKECFFIDFEARIHQTIIEGNILKPGNRVAIAASGGKDSTVLAYVLKKLNDQYNYGLHLVLLSVDEGISGYRDDSLATVAQNKIDYGLDLLVVSYQELFNGWTMDKIVKLIGLGTNCTFCGILRRAALELGARKLGVDFIATGHNADDIAETVLMNVLRGDINRLKHCTDFATNDISAHLSANEFENSFIAVPRIKPFKFTFEKEIVMYAYFRKLLYFSTECTYAPGAFRGHTRTFLKDLERLSPVYILNIIKSGEEMAKMLPVNFEEDPHSSIVPCGKCGGMANSKGDDSVPLCKACLIVSALDSNRPLSVLGNSRKYQQCTLNHK
jgi:cytoplasmic tRNA 2-thiolation protein 1